MDLQPSTKEKLRYDAATHDKSSELAIAVASFGAMCAWVWTLANRGSKSWYESWEKKLQSAEIMLTGPLFSEVEEPKNAGKWLSGKRYSVSRLAIGLSDYAVVFWLALLAHEVASTFLCCVSPRLGNILASLFVVGSVVYALVLRAKCGAHEETRKPDA